MLRLMTLGCLIYLGPMRAADIHAAAMNVIGQARTLGAPPLESAEQLTDSEKRAIGRYLETPQLEEVYPGLRGTAPRIPR
jgi:hypothetical protein